MRHPTQFSWRLGHFLASAVTLRAAVVMVALAVLGWARCLSRSPPHRTRTTQARSAPIRSPGSLTIAPSKGSA